MRTWLSKLSKSIAIKLASKWLGVRAWLLNLLLRLLFDYVVKPTVDRLSDWYELEKQKRIDDKNLKKYEEATKDGASKSDIADATTDLLNGN